MPNHEVKIAVFPKPGMPDPKSSDELRKLNALFPENGVSELKVGKIIGLVVDTVDEESARTSTAELADLLLVHPILENYHILTITPVVS